MSQRILIVTPAPRGSRKGNRVTAERWAVLLRSLGHTVQIAEHYRDQPTDLLVALHARKSAQSIARYHTRHPESPLLVVLTGTDIYRDLKTSQAARRSLDYATRLILLQPEAARELTPQQQRKARVILQSAQAPRNASPPRRDAFEVCVIGHLRSVKDPFRAAIAARYLPPDSKVGILHIGKALTRSMAARARRETARNPRYVWLGEMSHHQTLRRMAQCQAVVLSSQLEGGANVVSEAIVANVPVLASRIPGSIGLLGRDYPGFFEPGDTLGLAKLLRRVETDRSFLKQLRQFCRQLRPRFSPEHEAATWRDLIAELV
jgi:putative glycosyltransferase (TIGR04348 family)